jgi:hypothetical protein
MYGEFKWEEKYKTWDRMRSIHQNNSLPWVVMGDVNEILFDHEKEGGGVNLQDICRIFTMHLRTAICMILAMWGIPLHGIREI